LSTADDPLEGHDATVREERQAKPAPGGDPEVGTRVGDFVLRELLGRGGMGTVFLAEQLEPVRRQVALKLLKGSLDESRHVARFAVEQQALARMSHPAIAQVYDAGTTADGRPFLAMELVPGRPITEFCDQNALDLRQRLELLVKVCHGVQHAHQKGLIHRDLKPGNILVTEIDRRPSPKIIDFGIATAVRATDAAPPRRHRRERDWAGTPQYMSPEQAGSGEVDLDTRTDVYSLGAILYALLTGEPHVDPEAISRTTTRGELRSLLTSAEVEPPSRRIAREGAAASALPDLRQATSLQRRRLLRQVGEVDWIVLRALAPAPDDRYPTAAALAEDLEAFLAGARVEAVPPTVRYRLRTFTRRHRALLLGGGAVAAALVAGITLATWGLLQARQQRDHALAAQAQTRVEAAKSERVAAFTQQMLAGVDPAQAGAQDKTLLLGILGEASAKIDQELAGEPEVAAAIHHTIGTTYHALGDYSRAAEHFGASLKLREQTLGRGHPESLETLASLALTRRRQSRFEEAEELYVEAVEGLRATRGGQHPDTLSAMANLGGLYLWLGRFAEAERLFLEAAEGSRRVLGPDHRDTLTAINNLALVYSDQGRRDEAEPLYLEVLARSRRVLGPDHPDTLNSLNNLAAHYEVQGKLAEAEELYREAIDRSGRVLGPEHPDTLYLRNNLAVLHVAQGRHADAEALHRQVLAESRRVLGAEHFDTLNSANNLGYLYTETGRHAEAAEVLAEAATAARRGLSEDTVLRGIIFNNYGMALANLERLAEAAAALGEAHEVFTRSLGPDHQRTRATAERLAELAARRGD
jgi:eukaryotic-like serine/threonine-protein kinase